MRCCLILYTFAAVKQHGETDARLSPSPERSSALSRMFALSRRHRLVPDGVAHHIRPCNLQPVAEALCQVLSLLYSLLQVGLRDGDEGVVDCMVPTLS